MHEISTNSRRDLNEIIITFELYDVDTPDANPPKTSDFSFLLIASIKSDN